MPSWPPFFHEYFIIYPRTKIHSLTRSLLLSSGAVNRISIKTIVATRAHPNLARVCVCVCVFRSFSLKQSLPQARHRQQHRPAVLTSQVTNTHSSAVLSPTHPTAAEHRTTSTPRLYLEGGIKQTTHTNNSHSHSLEDPAGLSSQPATTTTTTTTTQFSLNPSPVVDYLCVLV